jgi:predicted kinase
MKDTVYLLCGLPGSGKSHWASQQAEENENFIIINRDKIREMFKGKYTYDKTIEKFVKFSCEYLTLCCYDLFSGFTAIIDETNITKAKRKLWIDLLLEDSDIDIICVYFSLKEGNFERRMKDHRGLSKETWEEVINNMKKDFEEPTLDEGFKGIIEIRT